MDVTYKINKSKVQYQNGTQEGGNGQKSRYFGSSTSLKKNGSCC